MGWAVFQISERSRSFGNRRLDEVRLQKVALRELKQPGFRFGDEGALLARDSPRVPLGVDGAVMTLDRRGN